MKKNSPIRLYIIPSEWDGNEQKGSWKEETFGTRSGQDQDKDAL
jgi:hypothetical protein